MSFSIKNIFQKGGADQPQGGNRDLSPQGGGTMLAPSPFLAAEPGANGGGFGGTLFRTLEPEASLGEPVAPRGGGSPFSPFGSAESTVLTVGDLLPQLPPEVARANGAMPDQPVSISPDALESAISSGQLAVPLFEVFRACPALFQGPVSPHDPRMVQLPRGKLPSMIASHTSALRPQGVAPDSRNSPFGQAHTPAMPPAAASPFAPALPELPGSNPPSGGSTPGTRPAGSLPPRRPPGMPPAIPTQADFVGSAPPSLSLNLNAGQPSTPPNGPGMPPMPGASPFANMPMQPAPQASQPSNPSGPLMPSAPGASPFASMPMPPMQPPSSSPTGPLMPSAAGASPFASMPMPPMPQQPAARPPSGPLMPQAPGASPFASMPTAAPRTPTGPLMPQAPGASPFASMPMAPTAAPRTPTGPLMPSGPSASPFGNLPGQPPPMPPGSGAPMVTSLLFGNQPAAVDPEEAAPSPPPAPAPMASPSPFASIPGGAMFGQPANAPLQPPPFSFSPSPGGSPFAPPARPHDRPASGPLMPPARPPSGPLMPMSGNPANSAPPMVPSFHLPPADQAPPFPGAPPPVASFEVPHRSVNSEPPKLGNLPFSAQQTFQSVMPSPFPAAPSATPPSMVSSAGSSEKMEVPLAAVLKGQSAADLGFDPNFIPAWITTKLPAADVREQLPSGEVTLDLGTIIDGTDNSFRSVISHGRRGFKVRIATSEVFQSMPPPSSSQPNSSSAGSPFAPPSAPPASPSAPPQLSFNSAFMAPSIPEVPSEPPSFSAKPEAPLPGDWGQPQGSFSPPSGLSSDQLFARPPEPKPAASARVSTAPLMPGSPPAAAESHHFKTSAFFGESESEPKAEPFSASANDFRPASKPLRPEPAPAQPPAPKAAPSPQAMASNMANSLGITAAPEGEQMLLRAIFGVSTSLTAERIVHLTSRLPGVVACAAIRGLKMIANGDDSASSQDFRSRAAEIATSIQTVAGLAGIKAETLSITAGDRLITFCFQDQLTFGVLHSDAEPPAGLREKITLLSRELAALPAAFA